MEEIKGLTELCDIGYKYGADKCPQLNHMYTPFYYEFFSPMRQKVKKLFEFGVGNKRIKSVIPHYQIGASLRMWREFFPNAWIYGADWNKGSVINEDRLTTYLANEDIKEDLEGLIKTVGSDIDIFIDDASHHVAQQIFLFKTIMPLLQKNVIYVIEDCNHTRVIRKTFPEYNSFVPSLIGNPRYKSHDGIIILTNK